MCLSYDLLVVSLKLIKILDQYYTLVHPNSSDQLMEVSQNELPLWQWHLQVRVAVGVFCSLDCFVRCFICCSSFSLKEIRLCFLFCQLIGSYLHSLKKVVRTLSPFYAGFRLACRLPLCRFITKRHRSRVE